MSRKRVLLKKIIERGIELVSRDLPRHQRAGREIRSHERLAHTPNRTRAKHRLNAVDYRFRVHTGLARDFPDRIGLKTLNPVLRHCENLRVDRICNCRWNGTDVHLNEFSTWPNPKAPETPK